MRIFTFEATYKWKDAELIQIQLVGTTIEADPGDPEDYFQFIPDNE